MRMDYIVHGISGSKSHMIMGHQSFYKSHKIASSNFVISNSSNDWNTSKEYPKGNTYGLVGASTRPGKLVHLKAQCTQECTHVMKGVIITSENQDRDLEGGLNLHNIRFRKIGSES